MTNVSDCFTAGKAVTVTVNDQPTVADITVADDVICAGGSSTLTASSAITGARFTWYSDATLTNVISTNATLTVSPAATTTYYVRLTNVSDCFTVGKAVTVTVNDQPTLADITVADDVICAGGSSTLTASSAITGARFTWYSDAALTNVISTSATLTVSPSTTTTYYVRLTNVSDCFTAGKAVTVTVNDQPTVADITVADDVICAGGSSTLTASSAITGARFTWYSDATLTNVISTNATLTVSPAATTTYYVRLTNVSDCFTAGKAVTVTVNDQPTLADITVADDVICAGGSSTLTASSAITGARFTWYSDAALSNVISTNATLTVSPSTTTTYYVKLTNVSDCFTAGKAVTVTVNDQPTVADITVADDVICAGASSTLTASSAITGARFTWYSDAALTNVISTNATLTVSPSATTTYYVRLTNISDCFTAGKAVTVTVNDQPTLADITVADNVICAGASSTLTASSNITGARFTWYSDAALSNVISTNATLTVSPSTTTTYYVRLTNVSDCFTGGKGVTVTVNDQPTVTDITVADDAICAGGSATLTASSVIPGARFTWYSDAALSNVISTNATLTVSPAATTTYYVRLTNVSDCFTAGKAVTVTVNDQPTLADITVADDEICAGGSSTLTATSTISGATFTWYSDAALSNVISNTATLTVSPSTTTTYYVRLTNVSDCFTAGKAVTVTVNDQPTVTDITVADEAICAGGSSTLTASSAITGARFTWYSDAALTNVISTNATLTVSPAATTTYYVRLTNVSDCFTAGKAVTVTVNDQPTLADITVADDVICAGASSALTASSTIAGAKFTWYSDAALTNVISTNATLTVSPSTTTTYYVRLTNASDCFTAGKAVTVTVNDQPTVADITVADEAICAGGNSTLTASSAITGARFTWYSDAALTNVISTNATLTVSPAATTTYYVRLTNVSDCFTAGKAVTVTVNDQPTLADITVADDVICAGASSTLTASSAITGARFTWYSDAALTNVISTNATLTVSPSTTTTYYVRLTNVSDCFTGGKAVTVTVNDQPTVAEITVADDVICAGGSSTLTASSAITGARFTWYSDAALSNVISNTATLTVSPSTTTTYYVRLTNVSDCFTGGKGVTVTVNDQPTVTDITVADDAICAGASSTLTASSAITGARFTWYSDAALTNVISTNATLTVSPSTTTTYYVRLTNVSDCFTGGKAVTVTVNDQPTVADITVADDAICAGGSATLTASSAIIGARFTWYSDAALTNVISNTATLTVSPAVTTTYYVRLTNASGCFTTGKAVTVTVNDQPTVADMTVTDDEICAGGSSTLTATSTITGATFTWYSDAALSNVISNAATLTVSPSTTTTYYVRLTNVSGCFTTGKAVTVTVNDQPTVADITVTDEEICAGGSSTLTATSTITGASFTWYSDAALSNLISNTATLTVSPAVTTTYYVRLTNASGCFTAGKAVTVTVSDQPTVADITVTDEEICAGASSTLTATSTITGASFTWYSDAALSNVLSNTATLTVSPVVTTTYYVRLTNASGCFTAGKAVTVTVNDQPTVADITVADDVICAGGSSTLTASSAITGARFTWYSDAALSNVISTNATLTVSPSTTTTYYVKLTNVSDCFTAGKAVTVTVNDHQPLPTSRLQMM
ncbi:S-layer family protein [Pedobacter sp. BAL39]|uniref:beta strand repeat-containing protein n=1 Tax=Pedobacter sp. BAL39 TaxID=391596 RepID=UPI0002EF28AB|nr:hypothetical protein [Pedobacter sp. BAL39]